MKPEILDTEGSMQNLWDYLAEAGSFDHFEAKPIQIDINPAMLRGIGSNTHAMDAHLEYKCPPCWIQFTVNSSISGYKVTNQVNQ